MLHVCCIFASDCTKNSWALDVFGDVLCGVVVVSDDLFFSHYPTVYACFIYIHGYPDNEAFNRGDPVVRTMNPITSCRLWDGMADSETDGRGCSRPAIQSHSSLWLPVSPVHVFCSNLSTGRGQRNLGSLHCTPNTHARVLTFPEVHLTPAMFSCTNTHLRFYIPSHLTLIRCFTC